MTVSPHILACIDAILKTSTTEAFNEKLKQLGYKVVPADAATAPEIIGWETWQFALDAMAQPGLAVGKFAVRNDSFQAEFKIGWLARSG